jgi:hypothetical protein
MPGKLKNFILAKSVFKNAKIQVLLKKMHYFQCEGKAIQVEV